MAWTTIKLSEETLDRLNAFGGASFEATLIEALDALEASRFWAEAEAAAQWRSTLSTERRGRRAQAEGEVDRAFDRIE